MAFKCVNIKKTGLKKTLFYIALIQQQGRVQKFKLKCKQVNKKVITMK